MKSEDSEGFSVARALHLCDVYAEGFDALAKTLRETGGIPPERPNLPSVIGMADLEAKEACLKFAKEVRDLTDNVRETIRRKRKKHLKNRFRYVNVEK